ALAQLFQKAGCGDVGTFIQSGNVVFTAAPALAGKIPTLIPQAMAKALGFQVVVVVRSAAEMAAVAGKHPLAAPGIDPKWLHVGFLAAAPTPAQAAALDPQRSPGDRFKVQGQHVFVHFGNGAGGSKLTAPYFDAKLGTTITLRNWNTVQKLAAMAKALG
ncbi:MAG TPA: DUF1697 domain-containing protein, partial [bacterium]|nr:DUF1697 domain-containing protein [bacterium]